MVQAGIVSALKSGPVWFLAIFLQNQDQTDPRNFLSQKKPDRTSQNQS